MQILILGANPVGVTLADTLSKEGNVVTVVDPDADKLNELDEGLDVRTVIGHPAYPSTLQRAEAEDATLLLAVTDNDEINMTACHVARTLFSTPSRICRLRSRSYLQHPELFEHEHQSGETLIHPEQLITNEIATLLEIPGASQVLDFADGLVSLVSTYVRDDSPLAGGEVREWLSHMPAGTEGYIAALYRGGRTIIPNGATRVEAGDEVFFLADKRHIQVLLRDLNPRSLPCRRVMFAGGGNIGERLAEKIEQRYEVRIIEPLQARCDYLAECLDRAIVVRGNAAQRDMLLHEDVHHCDVFCALTNDDSTNIMSSLLAKNLGAKRAIALVSDPDFGDLIHGGDIDIVLSPRQFTISSILAHVRRGEVTAVHSLRRGDAEALEIVLHGDARTSRVIGKQVRDLAMPEGATIGAVVRDGKALFVDGDTELMRADHIILFVSDRSQIPKVEDLFQVGFDVF